MVINDVARFNEFAESCGNRYLAVRILAKWARELGEELHEYHISESKLLEIILNGKYYTDNQMSQRRSKSADNLDDFLEWISDDRVINEVKYLYRQSVRRKRLQGCKNKTLSHGQRSRTNILLKMLWYSTRM